MTVIRFADVEEFPGWDGARALLRAIAEAEQPASVLEAGSGAHPTLTPKDVEDLGIDRYTTNDVSSDELGKAPVQYDTLVADLSQPGWAPEQPYDLIFSRMVNEHIKDGRAYYGNLFRALRPGGLTVHCFSTLYALPFVANLVLPDRLSHRALESFTPRVHGHEKFRACYSWSRGPTRRNIQRFQSLGYVVEEYFGYFGHGYYGKVPWLHDLERAKARLLVRHPIPQLTSYAVVKLRRP